MGFFAGNVDLTSPGPIGSTTPNTGAFTTLSFAPAANTSGLTSTSYSVTGANSTNLVSLSGTWNTTGTPKALLINITNTASNFDSRLIDLQAGGLSRFYVRANGEAIFSGNPVVFNSGLYQSSGNDAFGIQNGFGSISSTSGIRWSPTSNWQASHDLFLVRDGAAGTLAQRNSTNAQTFRLYNTFTDASNYERGFFRWNANVLEIGAEAAGTGTQRQLRLPLGTVTASTPLSVTQTWNSAGVTFTGILANITDTASASGSLLMDLQVGGSSRINIQKDGSLNAPNVSGLFPTWTFGNQYLITGAGTISAANSLRIGSGVNTNITSSGYFTTGSYNICATNAVGSPDVTITRDAADILAQRRTTNAQTFRLYRTFTDASNYERLGFLTTNTTRYTIASENAGTGSARSLEVSFYTAASDPTSTDITSGCFSVWKNSGTGTIKLWANDGGTMKSVALA